MAALFFFGSASAVLADTNNQTDHHGSVARRAVSVTMFTGAVNHAVKAFAAEGKAWLAPSQLALEQSAPFCRRGITDSTMVWIKLTEPGGKLIYVNLGYVISARPRLRDVVSVI